MDQIQDELAAKAAGLLKPQAIDDDLPGLGQHQCIPCSRFFISAAVLAKHIKTKPHKRRSVYSHLLAPATPPRV